jgi:hypothetical protein
LSQSRTGHRECILRAGHLSVPPRPKPLARCRRLPRQALSKSTIYYASIFFTCSSFRFLRLARYLLGVWTAFSCFSSLHSPSFPPLALSHRWHRIVGSRKLSARVLQMQHGVYRSSSLTDISIATYFFGFSRAPAWSGARASPTFSPTSSSPRPTNPPSSQSGNFPTLGQANGNRQDASHDRVIQALSGLTVRCKVFMEIQKHY